MRKYTTCSALEWNQMLGLCDQLRRDGHLRDYLLILSGCHFGLRIGDLLSLRWNDVLDKDILVLKEQKTGKNRSLHLHDRVREALEFCLHEERNEGAGHVERPLFANRKGEAISVSYVNKRLKWIFFKYRVQTDKPSSHTLRKTFGRRIYESQGQTEDALIFLSEIFSHANVSVTRRYLGITQKRIHDAYLSL